MLLGDKIITDSEILIAECLKCEHMNQKCSPGNRKELLDWLDLNKEKNA